MDCSPPGSSVHGILQARIQEWVAMPFSIQRNPRADLLQNGLVGSPCSPRDSQESSSTPQFEGINSLALSLFYGLTLPPIHAAAAAAMLLQSCLTLCDPIDGSPPGSPVPGIFQARILEWVAISFSVIGLPRANPRGRLRSPS